MEELGLGPLRGNLLIQQPSELSGRDVPHGAPAVPSGEEASAMGDPVVLGDLIGERPLRLLSLTQLHEVDGGLQPPERPAVLFSNLTYRRVGNFVVAREE